MAKNKVQFQKSLSLPEFMKRFGDESQCEDYLFHARWPSGFRCPNCGHDKHCQLHTRKIFQCNRCHHQTSLIAGTLFASSTLPLTTWFLGVYLLTQEKNGVSAMELHRQLGISYNAAWRMKHKLMQAMKEQDDKTELTGFIQLDDAYWGGVRRGSRGREAKGKRPFVAAVSLNEKGRPMKMRFSAVDGFKRDEITRWGKAHLSSRSLVISDGLACFNGITDADSFHLPIVTGGGPDCVELPHFKWVNTMISNVKNSIRGTYHALRLKHLPRYLGEFSYKFNRRFNLEGMIGELIRDSVKTPPMPDRLLKLAEPKW